jgi:hypothetical protein
MLLTSKKILLTAATISMIAGLALSVGTPKRTPGIDIDAATPQTHRRIYAFTKDDWAQSGNVFIHYWGGKVGTTWASCPQMTMVLNDYHRGMYYYDVPIDVTHFSIKNATGNATIQSDNISIASVFPPGDFKIAQSWGPGSHYPEDNAPMSSAQLAAVLNHIDSCSSCYAGGYNAWPQLNNLFVQPSTYETSEIVTDNFGPSTTIGDKIAWLEASYNADQAS